MGAKVSLVVRYSMSSNNLGEYLKFSHLRRCTCTTTLSYLNKQELQDMETADCWSNQLSQEIMPLIIRHLNVDDRGRMSCVCKSWRSLALQRDIPLPPQLPWLRLPSSTCKNVLFYDMLHGRFYSINLPKSVQGGKCCGSSKGWLAFVNGTWDEPLLLLLNPITGQIVKLPSLTTIPTYEDYDFYEEFPHPHDFAGFIRKVELSSDDPSNFIVSGIFYYREVIAICKPDDERWTCFQVEPQDPNIVLFADILFSSSSTSEGKLLLHALGMQDDEVIQSVAPASNFIMELSNSVSVAIRLVTQPIFDIDTITNREVQELEDYDIYTNDGIYGYLVESQDELLRVIILYDRLHAEVLCYSYGNFANENDDDLDDADYNVQGEEDVDINMNNENGELDGIDYAENHSDMEDYDVDYYQANQLKVLKMDNSTTSDLNDHVLFVGGSGSSLSLSAKDFNGEIERNCVHFIDDSISNSESFPFVSCESGIFSLDNGKIKRPYPSVKFPQVMNWFTPSLAISKPPSKGIIRALWSSISHFSRKF